MQTPHFFVARYAACAEQARLVSRAVESIRMWHPAARVTVVDDGSPAEFAYEPDGPLTDVVPNPYPRSGEVGTLRAAWAALPGPEDVAVAMHDSMVLTAPLIGLLAVTVVGIVVVPFVIAALVVAAFVGRVGVMRWIGQQIDIAASGLV